MNPFLVPDFREAQRIVSAGASVIPLVAGVETVSFFRSVLADQGLKVIAEFAADRKPRHHFFQTHEEAGRKALELDAAGKTVYHSCATFKASGSREAENAAFVKSFWVDADVEPGNTKKYESQRAALQDLERVCAELTLPLPLIVNSGAGIHAYWPTVCGW